MVFEKDLTVRSFNCLTAVGINTEEDFYKWVVDGGAPIRNLGQRSVAEINHYLSRKVLYNPNTKRLTFANPDDYERVSAKACEEKDSETDPALCAARRAYDFILSETDDVKLAAKAFNSYLIGRNAPIGNSAT